MRADNGLPPEDVRALGLERAEGWALLSRRHGHRLYRLRCDGRSLVLKWLGDSPQRSEVQAYPLLQCLGVPTPKVYGSLPHALLMEDLDAGPCWRLAVAANGDEPAVGRALAAWYAALHAAGERLRDGPGFPSFLARETDLLTPPSVIESARRLGLAHLPYGKVAAEALPRLLAAYQALPETLTYNDFDLGNLALSRSTPLRALVFDYGLLGIGPRCSDLRNVVGSLGPRAAAAFLEALPPDNPLAPILDAPLAALHALVVAAQRPRLPAWAQPTLREAEDGTLERRLRRALSALGYGC